jgi:hypothetical protein
MPNEKKTNSFRKISGVSSDHNQDRESEARKIIAKRNIITRTDHDLQEHQRLTPEVNTCLNTRTDRQKIIWSGTPITLFNILFYGDRILACMYTVKFWHSILSIELDFQMYLTDGHFLFIHFLGINNSSQYLVAATTSSQH